ncbi:MAG: Ig-like domain-containing protein [Chloroflexota bacterium]
MTDAQPTSETNKIALSTFDTIAIAIVSTLVIGIVGVLLMGDRVGVQITNIVPDRQSGSTQPITLTFSAPMNRATVEDNFQTDPLLAGTFQWSEDSTTLNYQPDTPRAIDSTHTVTVSAGAESQQGRELLEDVMVSYTVRPPQVLYLAPADSAPQNIYQLDLANPDTPIQLTDSETGIFDFAASPDGRMIAFAEYEPNLRDINMKLLHVDTGLIQTLTACQNATCTSPVWHPNGRSLVYIRVDGGQSFGTAQTRIWTVNTVGDSFDNEPFFDDNQMIGYAPQWSADGLTLAFYDPSAPGILVYDKVTQGIQFVPNPSGRMGALSDDAQTLIFADFTRDPSQPSTSFLQITDLENGTTDLLTSPDDAVDDSIVLWHPNDGTLTIGRRYTDDRATQGIQLYSLQPETGETQELVVDSRYTNAIYSWDATGTFLVVQRFQLFDDDGERTSNSSTEVWVYDTRDESLTKLAENAFIPSWLP